MERLYRSNTEKKVAGVCGGLGVYFHLDPTIVRLLVIIGALLTAIFPFVIGYIVAWIIVPVRPVEPVQPA